MDRHSVRYLLAVSIVSLAVLARLAMVSVIGADAPYLTVYLSVVFVSVLLGLGPGLAAAIVGIFGAEFLVAEPEFRIVFNSAFLARGGVIAVSAAYLGRIGDRLRRREQDLKARMSQLQHSNALSEALNNINAIINSTLDPDEIMKKVVVEAAAAVGCESSALDTVEDGKLTIRYAYNFPEDSIGRSFSNADVPFAGMALRTGRPVVLNDAFNDPRAKPEVQKAYGVRSVMTIPLVVKEAAFGVLFFNYHTRIADFTDQQVDFANKLSLSISLALENANLYDAVRKGEERLRSSEETLRLAILATRLGTFDFYPQTGELHWSDFAKEHFGLPPDARPDYETLLSGIHPGDRGRVDKLFRNVNVKDNCREFHIECRTVEGEDGKERWVSVHWRLFFESGRPARYIGTTTDITARKRMEEALRESRAQMEGILQNTPAYVYVLDSADCYIHVNQAYAELVGFSVETLRGKCLRDVFPPENAAVFEANNRKVLRSGKKTEFEESAHFSDGTRIYASVKAPLTDASGMTYGVIGISLDITERKRMEEEIRHMAQHDALTGLPNRRLFIDILNVELAQSRRHRSRLAVLFLDLDRFKEINDTLGHELGDRLLQEVARRFRATIRESDTVARTGGDEFNMILADILRPEDVSEITVKIVNSLREPVVLDGNELHISTSVGISIFPDDSSHIDTLLRYADIAMYHAKESGRNTYQFYNPSINVSSLQRMKMESWLREAITRGELSLLYQPQIDLKSKKIRYAEALVRWDHPERGLLEPVEFIPLAEETGFITAIDQWVLKTACAQAAAWKKAGIGPFCVAVNISPRQFQRPELVNTIAAIMKDTGMQPECLDLEITESTAMNNIEQTASQLRELTEMGVHISIDDFGTGYSSLNYLKKLPIGRIKIDKSFVRDIAQDPDDRAIISAVASMAHQMGIRTVAEGVETEEQFAFVRAAGCDEVQGFFVGRPVPAEQLRELIEKT